MTRLMRLAAGLAAAFLIPACSSNDDDWSWGGTDVAIYNYGPDSIRVECRYAPDYWDWDWDDGAYVRDYTLIGGEGRTETFPWDYDVHVRIYRIDGVLLFSEHYSTEDFGRHDGRVEITVHP